MSLDWNVQSVRDNEEILDGEQWQVTQTLIFGAMGTGIGTITEDNVPEIYARIHLIETLHGAFMRGPDGPVFITVADIRRRVGLTTNVFPTETRAKFLKRQAVSFLDDAVREAARAERVPA